MVKIQTTVLPCGISPFFCETLPVNAFKIAIYYMLESAWVLFRALHTTPLNFDQK